jgi:sortase B
MKNLKFNRPIAFILSIVLLLASFGCNKQGESSSSLPSSSEPSSVSQPSSEPEEPDVEWQVDRLFQIEKIDQGIERNKDTVGWLNIPGTDIDDAVLQRPGDNEYYLRLDEDLNYSVFGCYWADSFDTFGTHDELSKNTIIYGHSDLRDNPDGKKFSQLFRYTDADFVKKNPYIYFSTQDEDMIWQVFAVFFTHVSFVYNWANPATDTFNQIISEAKARSEFIIDMDVKDSDKILTLSTCSAFYNEADPDNYRLVVMAKLITDDMSTLKPTMDVAVNPSPKKS